MSGTERSVFYSTVGLGIGEETKSQTVEWLTWQLLTHTILRSGGSQCGHHVVREDGIEQMFSHFGAGTFEGAHTHLKHMVVNPVDLFTEAIELEQKGIEDPFRLLTIDKDCLAVTPFHGAMSRFQEIMRGANKKGTVGKGVSEAIQDAAEHQELAIHAGDFFDADTLRRKIEGTRQLKIQEAIDLIHSMGVERLPQEAYDELENLRNENLVQQTVDSMVYTADLFRIVDDSYLDTIMNRDGVVVGEPSHGALLHPWYGFIPHVTQIDPTAQDILHTLEKRAYKGKVIRLGVSRCYMTRHGAGPLVSFSREMTDEIHETHNAANPRANDWLGEFRNGQYDIVATKYAIEISGGRQSFDGLMISYLDKLTGRDEWQICEAYTYDGDATDLDQFFEMTNGQIREIKKYPETRDEAHYAHQHRLTQLLKNCHPVLKTLKAENGKTLEEVFLDYVEKTIQVPVVAVAYGPKKTDRKIRPGWEHLFPIR